MIDRIAEYGVRKCVIDGCFLPRYVFDECVCSHCGSVYQARESM